MLTLQLNSKFMLILDCQSFAIHSLERRIDLGDIIKRTTNPSALNF